MTFFNKKSVQLFGLALSAFLFLNASTVQANEHKKTIAQYVQELPWLGLISNEIHYGPITISNVNLHDGDRLVYALPGETLSGVVNYKVDSADLDSLHLYHLTVGIKGEGAQDCITHNLGVWNTKGHGRFTLKAPEKPGVYEVRFLFTEAATCGKAYDAWKSGKAKPSSSATIGVIIVENP